MSEIMTENTEVNKETVPTAPVDEQGGGQKESSKPVPADESEKKDDSKAAAADEQEQKKSYKARRKSRKLFWLVLKNTLVFWFPAIVLLAVIVFFTWKYPIVYRNISRNVQSLDEMQQWYDEKCYNVVYHAINLKYTGYDYYENDKLTGSYYYTFEGDRCLFILVKTKNPAPELIAANIHGRMLKDSAHTEAVLDQFASDVGMDQSTFFQVVYPLVVSEVDYSWTQTILIWLLVIFPGILGVITLVLGIEWIIRPYQHPNLKKLDEYGDRKAVYNEINSQLNREHVLHQDHYYFTDDYLILNRFGALDFVRIDRVRYISKHAWKDKKKHQKYRLIMSDDQKTYFERDFRSEEVADSILKEMVTRNAQIDDRTIHVFNIPASEAEAAQIEAAETKVLTADNTGLPEETVGLQAGTAVHTAETAELQAGTSVHAAETAGFQAVTAGLHAEEGLASDRSEQDTESPIGIDDAEELKIYKVRRRLRKKEEEADQVKIYKVRHRLRRDKDKHNE